MSVLRNLESKIAGLVEGTFSRVFRTEVRPVELARRLTREMDDHRTVSVSRTYVPNEFDVFLSPEDRERYAGVERDVADELAAVLLEHARRERYALVSRPVIAFATDDRLSLGEFGIHARAARPPEPDAAPAGSGRTMVYSSAERVQEPLAEKHGRGRAFVVAKGRRLPVSAGGAVLGRSRDCDVVLDDVNVSRKHAEIRPDRGGWTIADLGSTNGVRVNGHDAGNGMAIEPGDRIELGTLKLTFEVD